ncbi:MAG: transcription antitermination factor NusB [Spirochaetes bacterium]|nr:transcription antitermination factor NusB [Spirochaetota bacterium]
METPEPPVPGKPKIRIKLLRPPPPPGTKPPEKTKVLKKILSVEVPTVVGGRMNERRLGRMLALQALYASESQPGLSTEELLSFVVDGKPDKKALAFAALLVDGVRGHLAELDALIIPRLVNWEFSRISPVNKAILRLSLFSLLYHPDIPPKVTLNEAVDLAKMFSETDDFKFINALLDRVRRDRAKPELPPGAPPATPS